MRSPATVLGDSRAPPTTTALLLAAGLLAGCSAAHTAETPAPAASSTRPSAGRPSKPNTNPAPPSSPGRPPNPMRSKGSTRSRRSSRASSRRTPRAEPVPSIHAPRHRPPFPSTAPRRGTWGRSTRWRTHRTAAGRAAGSAARTRSGALVGQPVNPGRYSGRSARAAASPAETSATSSSERQGPRPSWAGAVVFLGPGQQYA